MHPVFSDDEPSLTMRAAIRAGAKLKIRAGIRQRRGLALLWLFIAVLLFAQVGDSALAFSPRDYPSYTLKIVGYDAVIFYRPRIGVGGLSTSIATDGHYETDVAPPYAEEIQKRIDNAQKIELTYSPDSMSSSAIDSLAKIPKTKPLAIFIEIHLQKDLVKGEIGNQHMLSAIERLSNDPDRGNFDEYGFRVLDRPVVSFVMRRLLYSRPDGRPLFFFQRPISSKDRIFNLTGSFLIGAHARIHYTFRSDAVAEKHWMDVDKAVLEFVGAVLTPRR
ncbi:MAG: hypothetical protein P8Z80_20785 [Pseudolabrys sp.]